MITKIFNQKYKLLVVSTLFLLGTAIYSNTFYSSFHFDDNPSIVENLAIRNIWNLRAIWDFWPTRFITYISLAFNYHLSQLNVFSYHLLNFLIHLCATTMVWWFIFLTFSTPAMNGKRITEYANLIAFFGGLIFIAHPIQTQAVTYVIQRAASLSTLFYLTCLSLYVKSRLLRQQEQYSIASGILYCGSLISAIMAMFTKEIAITLPLMILCYENCFFRTKEKFKWKYSIPFFVIILIIPTTMFLTKSVDFIEMRRTLETAPGISSWQYFCTELRVMVTYVRLLFIPINQNLDYDYHISKNLLELPTLFSLIFLVSILTIAIKAFSKYKLISFGIFWFFLTLLPESSIIPIKDVIYEHRLYLPMVGFSFFLTSGIYYIFKNKTLKSMVVALLVVTSCYAVLSNRRNLTWQNELILWNDTIHKSPNKAGPYNARGNVYDKQGDLSQAISDFNKAIKINPNYADAYYNRGNVYDKQGDLSQAISDFNKAIEITPDHANAYYNRGNAYAKQDNLPQAISDFNRAIEINPNFTEAYNSRGIICLTQGNLPQAISDFNRAIEINPNNAEAYNNRGNACLAQGNLPQAISDFNRAIEINPNNAEVYYNRSVGYYTAKEYTKAWADVHKAKELGCAVNPQLIIMLKEASGREN